jgi:hypothetical protein
MVGGRFEHEGVEAVRKRVKQGSYSEKKRAAGY